MDCREPPVAFHRASNGTRQATGMVSYSSPLYVLLVVLVGNRAGHRGQRGLVFPHSEPFHRKSSMSHLLLQVRRIVDIRSVGLVRWMLHNRNKSGFPLSVAGHNDYNS